MAAMTPPSLGASYLHNPKPVYPALARRLGEEGTVVLQVRVSANGLVDSVSIRRTSGYPELDRAALSAVRQWTFTPASRAGRPVAGWVLVPILFSLDESAG
jgi:protein TonB